MRCGRSRARDQVHGPVEHEVLRPGEEGEDGGQPLAYLGQGSTDAAGGAVVEGGVWREDRAEFAPPAIVEHGRIAGQQVVDLQAIRQVGQLVSHAYDRNNDARPGRAWWALGRVGRWHARW